MLKLILMILNKEADPIPMPWKHTLLVLLLLATLSALPASGPDASAAGSSSSQAAPAGTLDARTVPEDPCEIYIYAVIAQKQRRTRVSAIELQNGAAVACNGYVCGVELFSDRADLNVALDDGRPFVQEQSSAPAEAPRRYRYTYFPKVRGAAISTTDQFSIHIQTAATQYALAVQQNGADVIRAGEGKDHADRSSPLFLSVGMDGDRFQDRGRDLPTRIAAITEGIRHVETAFAAHLVDQVDILAFEETDNALTLRGHRKMWFYADTFWGRTVDELRAMAEHEALHLVVDQGGYAERTAIRELFSDLRGFDPFSLERFSLVTCGQVPDCARQATLGSSPLFAFINESNFIPGMSGGHSADSLDEFCTSLLHALMYLDHLGTNLQRSRLKTTDGGWRRITADEKKSILRDLTRTIDLFIAESGDGRGAAAALFHEARQRTDPNPTEAMGTARR
ncbi:MAG: hypothetical protein WAU91_10530 [Desulfatitalea sp.]